MILLANLQDKSWKSEGYEGSIEYLNVFIGIEKQQHENVFFNNLIFGFFLVCNAEIIFSKSYPVPGIEYVSTDQKFIVSETIYNLKQNENFTIYAWIEDGGERFYEIFEFLSARYPSPHPSWTWSDSEQQWISPLPMPIDENRYTWNEEILGWEVYAQEEDD